MNMNRPSTTSRNGALKRKRRSSDNHSVSTGRLPDNPPNKRASHSQLSLAEQNIENVPVVDKKIRGENHPDGEASTSDDRLPLTELSVLHIASGKERSEHGRLVERFGSEVQAGQCLPLQIGELLDDAPSKSLTLDFQSIGNRKCPIPDLTWVEGETLWNQLLEEDHLSQLQRKHNVFCKHPSLQPRMRSVLLDWIIEVSEVYKLHRETYYLCVDYLDRYLSMTENIQKNQLQLIGITCLLIASKVEEIYPPKIAEFAYVTDGACTENDIIAMELVIIQALEWKCSVLTPNSWLSLYLQICYKDNHGDAALLSRPQYPPKMFSLLAQLLDLAMLDERGLKFSYSVIAASCLFTAGFRRNALESSGLKRSEMRECVEWLDAFWEVIQCETTAETFEPESLPKPPSMIISSDYSHLLQGHAVTLELLESAQDILQLRSEPVDVKSLDLLTPPSSSKKPSRK